MRKTKILLALLVIAAILVSIRWKATAEDVVIVETPPPSPHRGIITPTPKPTPKPVVVTEYKSDESEAWLWETLERYSPSDEVTAGIMAYYCRESYWRSDAVCGWDISQAVNGVDYCAEFTAEIDAGLKRGITRETFVRKVHDVYGGYGLGQWSSEHFLEGFYDFASEWGTSIADAEMQCAYTVWSMQSIPELWLSLLEVESPERAGWMIATFYDGTETGAEYISNMAKVIYERRADNGQS